MSNDRFEEVMLQYEKLIQKQDIEKGNGLYVTDVDLQNYRKHSSIDFIVINNKISVNILKDITSDLINQVRKMPKQNKKQNKKIINI